MRSTTGIGLALLIIALMLFGSATLHDPVPQQSVTTDCPPTYEVAVAEIQPGPDPLPRMVEYVSLSLDEQEAFQLALAKNGTTQVSAPLFENIPGTTYRGDGYTVEVTEVTPEECRIDNSATNWSPILFLASLSVGFLGFLSLSKSLWSNL